MENRRINATNGGWQMCMGGAEKHEGHSQECKNGGVEEFGITPLPNAETLAVHVSSDYAFSGSEKRVFRAASYFYGHSDSQVKRKLVEIHLYACLLGGAEVSAGSAEKNQVSDHFISLTFLYFTKEDSHNYF